VESERGIGQGAIVESKYTDLGYFGGLRKVSATENKRKPTLFSSSDFIAVAKFSVYLSPIAIFKLLGGKGITY
jgi:hypothetical protein